MKRLLTILSLSLLVLVLLCGCSKSSLLDPKNPVTLSMWHNYGGDMQASMDMLIDQFNSTVGKEQGIVIDVTAISSSSELNKSLTMIASGDPGAPAMPDIFTGYPKVATQFLEKGLLVDLNQYFTEEELSLYVEDFLAEGIFPDGGLYVFPLAKSTEVLYLNRTLFDRFAAETGAKEEQLSTFEGIAALSSLYYQWTDSQTPDIPNDGKQFYAADSWFNFAVVGVAQKGESLFAAESLNLTTDSFRSVFETLYTPATEGGFAVYDGYSSDLSKTGDLVCSTGSSAGILFYGDTITYRDGTVETVEYSILPYPIFEGGTQTALQRGGGLMVAKSTEQKEYAASIFIKWLTAAEQNMQFVGETGYLPVTKQAFEEDMEMHLDTLQNHRVRIMLTSVLSMYESYTFFTSPNYSSFDAQSSAFEDDLYTLLTDARSRFLSGDPLSASDALAVLSHN